jgi:hypothetical protein
MGLKTGNRYGIIAKWPKNVYAHRASYEGHRGPIPDGMFVCHTCDNPGCINPDHLFLGTPADNTADMMEKGRSGRGERKGGRFTEDDVRAILQSDERHSALAQRYGVSQSHIHQIKHRKIWSHVS